MNNSWLQRISQKFFLLPHPGLNGRIVFLFLIMLIITSCGDTSLTRVLPNVSGSAGEVIIVMDKPLWDGVAGDAIREQVAPILIGLPQPEPAFTIMPVTPDNFRNVYMVYRNVIIAKIDENISEPEISYTRNKWAETQLVITITAHDAGSLAAAVKENGEAIRKEINEAEQGRLTRWLVKAAGKEKSIMTSGEIKWEMILPPGYKPDFNKEGIMMISAETPTTTQSVIVTVNDRTLQRIGCIELADLTEKVTSVEVKGPDGGSFMVIEKQIPVSCRSFRRNGTDYIEMRGLWTLEGGYMGGPFISYAFIDPETSKAVVVIGFVYAPRDEKRELLRQVEALMYTVKKAS